MYSICSMYIFYIFKSIVVYKILLLKSMLHLYIGFDPKQHALIEAGVDFYILYYLMYTVIHNTWCFDHVLLMKLSTEVHVK